MSQLQPGATEPIEVDSSLLARRSRISWGWLLVVAVLIALGATAASNQPVQVVVLVLSAVLAATSVVCLLRAPRLRVRLSDQGIEYRGAIRTLTLPWERTSTVGWLVFPRVGAMPRPLHLLVVKTKERPWPSIVNVTAETLSETADMPVARFMRSFERAMTDRGVAYRPAIPDLPETVWAWIVIAIAIATPLALVVAIHTL